MPVVSPPGVRRLAGRPAQHLLQAHFPERQTERQDAADGRLPALPRYALRGRYPRPGNAAGYGRTVGDAASRPEGSPGDSLPELPPDAPAGRAPAEDG